MTSPDKLIRVISDEPPVRVGDTLVRQNEERRVIAIERDPTRVQPTWKITLQAA